MQISRHNCHANLSMTRAYEELDVATTPSGPKCAVIFKKFNGPAEVLG